jgi:hypothetical protein
VHSIAANVIHGTLPKLTLVVACLFACARAMPSPTMIMSRMKHTVVSTVAVMIIPSGKSEVKSPRNSRAEEESRRAPQRWNQLGRPVSEMSQSMRRRKRPEKTAPHAICHI